MKHRRIDIYVQHIQSLFRTTLYGGSGDDGAWKAIRTLRRLGNRLIFDRAKSWCQSANPRKRARGADVLAQLRQGARNRPYRRGEPLLNVESVALIQRMLAAENDLDALDSEIAALGHLDDASSVSLVAPFADHPTASIRNSVTHALGNYPNEPIAVMTLTKLMDDADREVRDWAIFGVGVQGDADSEELRLAFIAHLRDPYLDARQEAAAALAKRQDVRVVRPLIDMFKRYGDIKCLCDAARDLLQLEDTPKDWTAEQYVNALEAAFPATA